MKVVRSQRPTTLHHLDTYSTVEVYKDMETCTLLVPDWLPSGSHMLWQQKMTDMEEFDQYAEYDGAFETFKVHAASHLTATLSYLFYSS